MVCNARSSPRSWGCFWPAPRPCLDHQVFPTFVGVFLSVSASAACSEGLPHALGGVLSGAVVTGCGKDSVQLSFEAASFLFFYRVLRLLPGMGGGSPARRGAWGERGSPSTPPAPPYSPFCGSVEGVSLVELYPARRVSLGRRREPSRPFRPGDVRACCGAPSARRAPGIAFAPAPSLRQSKGRKWNRFGRRQKKADGQRKHRRGGGGK